MHERVLFVALIFLMAYMLKLTGIFREEHSKVFIDYVLYFSLPALVVQKVREINPAGESLLVVLIAWACITLSLLLSYALGRAMGLGSASLRAFMLVSSFGNTAFMGYPFTFAFFGDEGLTYAILYDQLGSFLLVVSIGFLVATGSFSVREVILFPPFLAFSVGFLSRGVPLPDTVQTFLEVSGKSLIPVVLFAVGLRFTPQHLLGSFRETAAALSLKMVFVPLLLLILLKAADLEGTPYRVALLETCMPPMVMAGILAIKYGLDEKLALSSIAAGIVLSFFTVPLFLSLY